MTLQNEISKLLGKMSENIPLETGRVMAGATKKLKKSGLLESALRKGDIAPQFELPNINSKLISSSSLLTNGPLILSFYRGSW